MSAWRASGALSRTKTPQKPERKQEPEPEPNHRYRVGQVVRMGGTKSREDAGVQAGEGGCRGLAQAGAEEVRTLTQARFLRWPPENSIPSRSAVSLGGTEAQDKLERGSGTRVVEEGLHSRGLAPLVRTSTPGPDSSLVG